MSFSSSKHAVVLKDAEIYRSRIEGLLSGSTELRSAKLKLLTSMHSKNLACSISLIAPGNLSLLVHLFRNIGKTQIQPEELMLISGHEHGNRFLALVRYSEGEPNVIVRGDPETDKQDAAEAFMARVEEILWREIESRAAARAISSSGKRFG
ncbi:hypothetical protein EK21DRAFT_91984 [Setomelanomma holmii]|uniref:Uncharacterized protein n=1 Tax=Setomelanomma holmii TaxID=210430 RepID=A0A9P4H549_9PLEO|nr:hypothetical protein EK21DRAFT_91984 [Setomelanomma holmii]